MIKKFIILIFFVQLNKKLFAVDENKQKLSDIFNKNSLKFKSKKDIKKNKKKVYKAIKKMNIQKEKQKKVIKSNKKFYEITIQNYKNIFISIMSCILFILLIFCIYKFVQYKKLQKIYLLNQKKQEKIKKQEEIKKQKNHIFNNININFDKLKEFAIKNVYNNDISSWEPLNILNIFDDDNLKFMDKFINSQFFEALIKNLSSQKMSLFSEFLKKNNILYTFSNKKYELKINDEIDLVINYLEPQVRNPTFIKFDIKFISNTDINIYYELKIKYKYDLYQQQNSFITSQTYNANNIQIVCDKNNDSETTCQLKNHNTTININDKPSQIMFIFELFETIQKKIIEIIDNNKE